MKAGRLKKISKKVGTKENWEVFRLTRAQKSWIIGKVKKKSSRKSSTKDYTRSEKL